MQFAVPIVWNEPTNYVNNRFFCMTPPMNMGWLRRKKDRLQYPCIPSAIQTVLHSADMPIPDSPKKYEIVRDYVVKRRRIH
ncbi:hypothetical protein TNCT_321501 [Trichonephila clavata]|uniref:Uncharacterized protein n=1 Tax=Trichonephila clavata TaxID=2740835 RepID=A0A8X6KIQ1_TRICU|nr:hypothetical protein TNCT_321501 [Trichonephila clavata]